jgi:CubicO group peptidase (beta-lactamase class C family)
MDVAHVPGLALAIVKGEQIVHMRGFGHADDAGRAITPQTPFVIGSTTKSFTALAIMQLVDAGKVELDAPVQRYLPWFRVSDPAASSRITIRHLLNQTSGHPRAAGESYLFRADSSVGALEHEVRALAHVPLAHAVDQSFEYSNINYGILGLVIEAASGQPYEQYIQEHVFSPLQMAHSFADYKAAKAHDLAQGYLYWWAWPRSTDLIYNRAGLPSGYLVSSAEDMGHYLIAQLNQGRYGAATIPPGPGITAMHRPAVPAAMMGEGAAYGMGWFVSELNGVPAVWAPGGVLNFHSDLILAPEHRWGMCCSRMSPTLAEPVGQPSLRVC